MTAEPTARRAVLGDEEEIARLRDQMRSTLWPDELVPDEHHGAIIETIRGWLKDPDTAMTAAFVVDAPDGNGLAASVIGAIDLRLPSAKNPSGLIGYVYGVCTDQAWRRRGFSRLAMVALLDWYERRDVIRVELHASEYGESLYRELGFTEPYGAALTRRTEPMQP